MQFIKDNVFRCNGLACAVAIAASVIASSSVAKDAGTIELGAVQLTPDLEAGFAHDTNVYKTKTNERSSNVFQLNPSLEFKAMQGVNEYTLLLDADSNRYTSEREADYTDVQASFDIHQELNSRHRFDASVMAGELHDANSRRASDSRRPPEYIKKAGDLVYGFGRQEARIQFELFGGAETKNYKKTNDKDASTKNYGGTLYYRVMPKTRVLLEAKRRELMYDDKQLINGSLQNAGFDITSYLFGLNWDATAKTSGYVKLGRRYRDVEVAGVGRDHYTGWEVGVSYLPLPYSVIQLSTSRDYGLESDDPASASFTNGTNTTLSWSHDWSDRFNSMLSWTVVGEDVQDAQGKSLKDRDSDTVSLELGWTVDRWLKLTAGYTYDKRGESLKAAGQVDNGFSRHIYSLGAKVSL